MNMKGKQTWVPVALTVAGSDSGGGAGVQADLKTFAALGVHGTSAITCLTAQNPKGVQGIRATNADFVRLQMEAVFAEMLPGAIKTGMLFDASIIRTVASFMRRDGCPPLIVDPVMVATSGTCLLKRNAVQALLAELLPMATLVTPNIDEAQIILDRRITSLDDLRSAARDIKTRFGCAALVKGGHLTQLESAVDFYYDGTTELLLKAPFVKGVSTHGTGCTYSAAITAFIALGDDMATATSKAKEYITQAIAQSILVSGHHILNWLPGR